ncbi:MAG: hypothetical protein LQ346_002193 [Caloplaca aetnensis]|nr:MAG: hypothetical protein LQ346_002193 [Caloplaca aetnensis]
MLAEPTAVSKQPVNPQAGEKRKFVSPGVGGIEGIDLSYTRIEAHIKKSIFLLEAEVHAWIDLVREWSIRMRGEKDLAQILRVRRVRKPKIAKSSMPSGDPSAVSEGRGPTGESQILESLATAANILSTDTEDEPLPDDWQELVEDCDEQSMTGANTGLSSHYGSPTRTKKQRQQLPAVIEDSEWDSAEVLD